MSKAWLLLARITQRLHLWRLTVLIYAVGAGSFTKMKGNVSYLLYALMMCRRSSLSRNMVARLIRSELNSLAENNLWLARMTWALGESKLAVLIYKKTECLFSGQSSAATASSLCRFAEGVLSGVIASQLDAAIQRMPGPVDGNRLIVLTLVSRRFLSFFDIWYRQMRQYTSGCLLILALDQETVEVLQGVPDCNVIDVSAWFDFDREGRLHPASTKHLWVLRVLALRAIVRGGYDVASLDVDAVMVGNLDEMLSSFPTSDIVAQMDYSIPMEVARRFGFILCCGFLVLRASDRIINFLDKYSERTILEVDDQLAINHLLLDHGISEKVQTDRFTAFHSMGLSWLCPAPSLVSREIGYGDVVRHFLLKDLTADAVIDALGLR